MTRAPPARAEPSGTSATPIRFFSRSMLRISNAAVIPGATERGPSLRSPRRRERGGVRQPFDPRLELDERPELREARDAAGAHLADLVRVVDPRPRIGGELLQPEGDLLLVLVDAQDLDGDLLAGLDDLRRVRHAGPPHLGHVQQALHAAARSTNAPNSRTEATRPVITAPATIDRRTSAALARCSSSSSARRETTRFLPPSLYSMIRNA